MSVVEDSLRRDIGRIRRCAERVGLPPTALVRPVALALGVGVFEAAGVSLMVPLARGLVGMDFSFLRESQAVRLVEAWFPGVRVPVSAAFAGLVTAIFASFVLKNGMQYASSVAVARVVRRLSNGLRKLIFSRYMGFGKLFFDRNNAGHLQAVAVSTVEKLVARLADLHYLFAAVFTLAAYVAVMLYISIKITLLLVLCFPLLNSSLAWIIPKVRRASASFIEAQGEMNRRLFNALSCIPLVKAYSMERGESDRFAEASDAVEAHELSMDRKVLVVLPLQEVIVLGLVLLLVAVMAYIVSRQGSGRLPGFLVFFYVLRRAASSFSVISHVKTTLSAVSGPLDEIEGILDEADKHVVPSGKDAFPGLRDRIEFRGLEFGYGGGDRVLRGVSFSIERGRMTAVVGPTGSGKSTLAGLLARLYDAPPGALLVDGSDVRSYSLESYRRHLAIVSQDTNLFNGTLRENIAYGLTPEPSAEAVAAAVERARLSEFVSRLPRGLETPVGDRGVQLSGGERQRVSIARAFLKGSEILILDEATSALDSTTERLIQEAIDEMVGGKTAVVIAHRLSTIKRADKIVVLERGEVVEQGELASLLAADGAFRRHWEAQKFH